MMIGHFFPNSPAMVSLHSQEMLLLAALLSVFNTGTDSWPSFQMVKGGLCLFLRVSSDCLLQHCCMVEHGPGSPLGPV